MQLTVAATSAVDQYAGGAPAAIKVVAVELLLLHMREQAKDGRLKRVEFGDQEVELVSQRHLMMSRSGAASLLSMWRSPPVLSLSDDD